MLSHPSDSFFHVKVTKQLYNIYHLTPTCPEIIPSSQQASIDIRAIKDSSAEIEIILREQEGICLHMPKSLLKQVH